MANLILDAHVLPNGRKVDVIPLTYGRARICLVNERERFSYDDTW